MAPQSPESTAVKLSSNTFGIPQSFMYSAEYCDSFQVETGIKKKKLCPMAVSSSDWMSSSAWTDVVIEEPGDAWITAVWQWSWDKGLVQPQEEKEGMGEE